jgi:excisionase family DNA binding protein
MIGRMENTPPNDLISTTAAAKILRTSTKVVYRWVLTGKLRAWKRMGRYFLSTDEVKAAWVLVQNGKPLSRLQSTAQAEHAWAMAFLKERGVI